MAKVITHHLVCPHCKRTIHFHQAFFYLENGELMIELVDYCTACKGETVSKKFTVPELIAKCHTAEFEELAPLGKNKKPN